MNTSLPFHFDDAAQTIHITDPCLPGPWTNYLSNGNLHALVSQAGGGFTWWRSPLTYRITRYRHHHQPIDSPGFYIYIRHKDGRVWSPAFRPCEDRTRSYEVQHAPGRSVYEGREGDLCARLEFFVTPDYDVLAWDLQLTNEGGATEEVDVFAYSELSQHQWEPENGYGYYIRNMVKGWFDEATQSVKFLYHEPSQPEVDVSPMVWFASSARVKSASAHRDGFIGNYRSERLPEGVEINDCGNQDLPCGEGCVALQCAVAVAAGEEQNLAFYLGVQPGGLTRFDQAEEKVRETVEALRQTGALAEQKQKLMAWWADHLGRFHADLPDPVVARSVNTWTPVNTVHTSRYSRGINALAPGVRGMGYRDTAQDMLAMVTRKPDWALDNLRQLLLHQFEDGHTVHMWFPHDKGKLPSDSLHSDNHLWPPLLAYALLSETGDASFLEEPLPYLSKDMTSSTGTATLWEHLVQGIRFTASNLGAHGLPLTFKGDWNDIIGKFSKEGKGESVFAGQQYIVALDRLLAMARFAGKEESIDFLTACRNQQVEAQKAHAWDGKWWRRGYDDQGEPVGSEDRPFGKIFLNPQSWAILAGLGTHEQQLGSMEAVAEHLDAGIGLKAMAPGFNTFPEETDPFSGYGPGCAENGSVFCHANTWAIMAEAMIGRADMAWKYYTQLIPENVINKVGLDRYKGEPYAWTSMITGPENEAHGWANCTQISGTVAWMDVVATQYLLGVRPEPEGLRIDPCIPAEWDEYRVRRRFRGAECVIEVKNPSHVSKGVASATLDGEDRQPVNGSLLIPAGLLNRGGQYLITIQMAD